MGELGGNERAQEEFDGRFDRRTFLALLGGAAAGVVVSVPADSSAPSQPARHSSVHEAISSLPPEGGEIYLTATEYAVDSPVVLGDGVSLLGAGRHATVLKPTGDFDVVSVQGTNARLANLKIHDRDRVQTKSYGLTLTGAHQSIISDVVIAETANGLLADSVPHDGRDVWENSLRAVHVRDTRGDGFKFQGAYHDNSHVDLFANSCRGDGFVWETTGVDGGNKYTQCIGIACEVGFRVTTAQELWLDQIIADTNRSTGFFVDGGFDGRLFGGQFWTSTNGNNGLELSTRHGGVIADVYIDQLYSWQNHNFGLLTDGGDSVSRVVIGMVSVHHNRVGARFAARTHDEVRIQWLHSRENAGVGVDGSGGRGVSIETADVADGWNLRSPAIQRWSNVGISRARPGAAPDPANWNQGDLVQNLADDSVWFKSIASDEFIRIG